MSLLFWSLCFDWSIFHTSSDVCHILYLFFLTESSAPTPIAIHLKYYENKDNTSTEKYFYKHLTFVCVHREFIGLSEKFHQRLFLVIGKRHHTSLTYIKCFEQDYLSFLAFSLAQGHGFWVTQFSSEMFSQFSSLYRPSSSVTLCVLVTLPACLEWNDWNKIKYNFQKNRIIFFFIWMELRIKNQINKNQR